MVGLLEESDTQGRLKDSSPGAPSDKIDPLRAFGLANVAGSGALERTGTVAIVGVGLIGGSIGLGLKSRDASAHYRNRS